MDNIKAIQRTIQETNEWVNDLCETYEFADKNKAFVLLRATLKALRDRITPGEALHLGGQLPALLRGFYFEGWSPNRAPSKDKTEFDFITSVKVHLAAHDDIDLEMAVPEAMRVILERIDQGEARQVRHILPKDIQELCP